MIIDTKTENPKDSTSGIKENQLVTLLKSITFEIGKKITHQLSTTHSKWSKTVTFCNTS